jgi:hypothetical protein
MDKTLTKEFFLERETKGAARYAELNAAGNIATMEEFAIGTLYLRKKVFNGSEIPERLTLTINFG